jgi:hypothetical protein
LHTRNDYKGRDQVHNASAQVNIGQLTLHTLHSSIQLCNIFHIPSATRNHLSSHKIALDNNSFVEFHHLFFLIKDRATKKIMFCSNLKEVLHLMEAFPELGAPKATT